MIEAELDTGAAARRLRKDIAEVFGHASELLVLAPERAAQGQPVRRAGVARRRRRWPARPAWSTATGGRSAACPAQVVSGATCDAEAAWRGAFLAHGSLTEPGRSLVAGGHLPRARRRRWRWSARPAGSEIQRQGPRGARGRPGGGPRRRRDRRAADPARRARLGAGLGGAPDAPRGPGHRQPAGQLRRRQPAPLAPGPRSPPAPGSSGRWRSSATRSPSTWPRPAGCASSTGRRRLEELGQLADPPLTKDAIAGRIRRLLAMADQARQELGIPGTEANLTPDMMMP